jgi:hypothetical protein
MSGLLINRIAGVDGYVFHISWDGSPQSLPLQGWPVSPRRLLADPLWMRLEVLDELADAGQLTSLVLRLTLNVGTGTHRRAQ